MLEMPAWQHFYSRANVLVEKLRSDIEVGRIDYMNHDATQAMRGALILLRCVLAIPGEAIVNRTAAEQMLGLQGEGPGPSY
jgi:hypothetical protein